MEEEKIYKDIELRSEEVQEVMNHISPWVVRCGITVLAVILLMVLVGCWIFRYPDTLAAEVTLATEEPPAFVLSHATGKLDTLYVKNGSSVEADTDLGVIGDAALRGVEVRDRERDAFAVLVDADDDELPGLRRMCDARCEDLHQQIGRAHV